MLCAPYRRRRRRPGLAWLVTLNTRHTSRCAIRRSGSQSSLKSYWALVRGRWLRGTVEGSMRAVSTVSESVVTRALEGTIGRLVEARFVGKEQPRGGSASVQRMRSLRPVQPSRQLPTRVVEGIGTVAGSLSSAVWPSSHGRYYRQRLHHRSFPLARTLVRRFSANHVTRVTKSVQAHCLTRTISSREYRCRSTGSYTTLRGSTSNYTDGLETLHKICPSGQT